MAPREILGDTIGISLINLFGAAEACAALGLLVGHQMPFTCAGAHDFAGAGDFKPLGYRFPRLYTFWASHIVFSKKSAKSRHQRFKAQAVN